MKNLNNIFMPFKRHIKQLSLSYCLHVPKISTVSDAIRAPFLTFLVSVFLLALVVFYLQISVSFAASKNSSKLMALGITNKTTSQPSLKEMIGQMLMLGFKGVSSSDKGSKDAHALLKNGQIGGLIFMGHNMSSKTQITQLVSFMKKGSPKKLPPLLAIDQEGGQVQRLKEKHGFTTIPTASSIALANDQILALQTYQTLAEELASAGFNVNFGPVVDLNIVPENPIIGARERSYGFKPETVQTYSSAFILAHRQNKILTSLKHFPGHGSSWTDSHEQFVDLTKSWKKVELAPYKLMVKKQLVDMVMVGHLYHPSFSDRDKLPASLSKKAIEGVLRQDIGYQGIVITDDLGMGAIKKYFEFDDALIKAVKAGNDILLIVDGKYANPSSITRIQNLIIDAVKRGDIQKSSIEASYQRIIAAKKKLN
jgi:beta-N-acetylhexosaminidase